MEKRLLKLTFNSGGWIKPMGDHIWDARKQGDSNTPYENQYGFGHEEWLLNPVFQHEGRECGYIRRVKTLNPKVKFIDEVFFDSNGKRQNRKVLVGSARNIDIIKEGVQLQKITSNLVKSNQHQLLADVSKVNADIAGLLRIPQTLNVRIPLEHLVF